VVNATFRPL